MRLYTEYTQEKKGTLSTLRIEVNYDHEQRTWLNVVAIESYDPQKKVTIDITSVLMDMFPNETGALISSIDWESIAKENK